MDSLKPLFEEIAREKGSLVLSLYFEPRNYVNSQEKDTEQQRLQEQMQKYQHSGISKKRVNSEETQLVLNSPEHLDTIIKEVSLGYKGMVYDIFLADDSGNPYGRAWGVYDFMNRIDGIEGICLFYNEIAKSSIVSEKFRPKLIQTIREAGTIELKKRGFENKVTEWELIIN